MVSIVVAAGASYPNYADNGGRLNSEHCAYREDFELPIIDPAIDLYPFIILRQSFKNPIPREIPPDRKTCRVALHGIHGRNHPHGFEVNCEPLSGSVRGEPTPVHLEVNNR
jgi:hypothetical protein